MRLVVGWMVGALLLAGCGMEADGAGLDGDCCAGVAPAPWHGGERYEHVGENPFVDAAIDPVATFGVDVDTASYSIMRRDVEAGYHPHPDGVRVEEYLNYFSYGYEPPADEAFSIDLEAAPSPFGAGLHLLRVGLQARTVADRGRANLVFLVDVSGSMDAPDKLPLVRRTLEILVDELRPDDRVAIVVYAGSVGTLLEPTPASEREAIRAAIGRLSPGGSTNGAGGIRAAYALARRHFVEGGINRVILATDGDFNVGLVGGALVELIKEERASGVYLTTLGFGRGNYDAAQMERLAAHGNGNYAYVDGEGEAARVVRRDLLATMVVVAEDTRVQVQFAPSLVKRWRLLGYENRALDDEQFTDDEVDTGDVGAGQDVTALFEIELREEAAGSEAELARVLLRYHEPGDASSRQLDAAIAADEVHATFGEASDATRFAAAVAEFAEILRGSQFSERRRFGDIRAIASSLVASDPDRAEFLDLVSAAGR